jgi:hypothetical protein
MSVQRRAALVVAAPVVLVGSLEVAWRLLPGVQWCPGLIPGSGAACDTGGAKVFGFLLFTPAQSVVMALGIWAAAAVFGRGVLPARSRWTPVGFGVLALAVVIAFTLPSPTTGSAPSVPCSTPGPSGPVVGRCVTGSPPVDERLSDRAATAAAGLLAFGVAALLDRRRGSRGQSAVTTGPRSA